MKIAVLRASAAVAIVVSFSLTELVAAEESAGPEQASVERSAGAPQDVRATVVTPGGRQQQSATVEWQRVPMGDGATVTVLRPVAREKAPGQEQEVRREEPLTWQLAAGQRLWLIDPATGDLRTCAVRQTSTVGVQEIRCLSVIGAGL